MGKLDSPPIKVPLFQHQRTAYLFVLQLFCHEDVGENVAETPCGYMRLYIAD